MSRPNRFEAARLALLDLPVLVRNRRTRDHLSLRAAAAEIGVSHSMLWKLEQGADATTSTLDAVLTWMATP